MDRTTEPSPVDEDKFVFRPMLLTVGALFLVGLLLGEIQAASAQSPTSYPWCSKNPKGGGISCRYTSYEQCRQSNFGVICVLSPYHPAAPTTAPPVGQPSRPARPHHRRHT